MEMAHTRNVLVALALTGAIAGGLTGEAAAADGHTPSSRRSAVSLATAPAIGLALPSDPSDYIECKDHKHDRHKWSDTCRVKRGQVRAVWGYSNGVGSYEKFGRWISKGPWRKWSGDCFGDRFVWFGYDVRG